MSALLVIALGLWWALRSGADGGTAESGAAAASAAASYSVGGSASGITGSLVLQNNLGDDLSLTADGDFDFATALDEGGAFSVTVLSAPEGQTCTVDNAQGTIQGADVTDVAVQCVTDGAAEHTLGGTVSGLGGTLVLQNNGGDDAIVEADGTFAFAETLEDGDRFHVTVKEEPAGQVCTVDGGRGAIDGADVTTVQVTCVGNPTTSTTGASIAKGGTSVRHVSDEGGASDPGDDGSAVPVARYGVGGSVSGLDGTLVLLNDGTDTLTVSTDGPFTFATTIEDGSRYDITVKTQPAGGRCTVTDGSGTVDGAAVTSVAVTCLSAPVPALSYGLKAFSFTWAAVGGADYYQLYEDPDGASGLSLIADHIDATSFDLTDVVLYNRINAQYQVTACNADGCVQSDTMTVSDTLVEAAGHFRESSPASYDYFGISVALSGDGRTMVVGAYATNSYKGSATVFVKDDDGTWREQEQLFPVTSSTGFGFGTALNADGTVLVVGGYARAHIYQRSGDVWTLITTLHPTGITSTDYFGWNLGLSADGKNLAVSATGARTVYVFGESGGIWSELAQLTGDTSDWGYGASLSMADDGSTLAVGSEGEGLGYVYLYDNDGGSWTRQTKLQATGLDSNGGFGSGVALDGDGSTLAVGAAYQNGYAGKAYIFTKDGGVWMQQAVLEASNGEPLDYFGAKLDLTKDGSTLAVTATYEAGGSTGLNGPDNNDLPGATNNDDGGAAYVFTRSDDGTWSQKAYVKGASQSYYQRAISLAYDGTLAVGALVDQSDSTGVSFGPGNPVASAFGGVFLY
ncbi:FG-GAP repeat protein [Demequina capsici]|uniref:FG-GAP repeat protein n=1 Tax=Demequina capsici TaxID=3075620 RepID=A0AA96FGC0_9MICO|nr:FG-GAP repeat protein [Demequina sp. PMTSA13]WNM28001.1 FG-GAP repeat protein [Demequina sp. PMTSA13]